MRCIGIDIGTTTLCGVVLDTEKRQVLKALTISNGAEVPGAFPWQRCQDPQVIVAKTQNLLEQLLEEFEDVKAIGVTGQMHGVVYCDAAGKAVSNLYTWQDESGNQLREDGEKWAAYLTRVSGYNLASGFGCVTHACNAAQGLVPAAAAKFCTIHDYLVMVLTSRTQPLCHATDAASFGCYDLAKQCFDLEALARIGVDRDMLPETTDCCTCAGSYRDIPVYVAIGDNQASFLGAVPDVESGVLVNIGTGSQVSVMAHQPVKAAHAETRPFMKGSYLVVGASLCGGRAYAALESFFRSYAKALGVEGSQYELLGKLSKEALELPQEQRLKVSTLFCGTRTDSQIRGSVTNISLENLTPGHLIAGFLEGTVDELYQFYQEAAPLLDRKPSMLIGSGNGLRKNLLWQQIAREMFDMELQMSDIPEEAACGAAIFASGAVQ